MMRILFVLLLSLFSIIVDAQQGRSIHGRWKIVSIADEEMYYNFKKDSVSLSPVFSSPMDKAQAKELIALLLGMAGDGIFIFGKDGHYELLHDTKQDGVGTYIVSDRDSLITANVVRNGVKVIEKMKFYIKEQLLHLTKIDDGRSMKLVLEKLPEN
ncbi:hypothetical protein EXU57_09790 [Segetibacter sp. 3557_3]|uniref:hypothetical protein n=1 Tax=Segetibacter sp. 3557_3 TaxID=2547429 RepID=UPI00105845E3|nr:hypothetical protein [Segetibacter sp. 3557_3]TDH26383.1 hypothetical protein EXU57_09790 [Segetibacter sp. 3557_3]